MHREDALMLDQTGSAQDRPDDAEALGGVLAQGQPIERGTRADEQGPAEQHQREDEPDIGQAPVRQRAQEPKDDLGHGIWTG